MSTIPRGDAHLDAMIAAESGRLAEEFCIVRALPEWKRRTRFEPREMPKGWACGAPDFHQIGELFDGLLRDLSRPASMDHATRALAGLVELEPLSETHGLLWARFRHCQECDGYVWSLYAEGLDPVCFGDGVCCDDPGVDEDAPDMLGVTDPAAAMIAAMLAVTS